MPDYDNDQNIIENNASRVVAHPKVTALTSEIGGTNWAYLEYTSIHPRLRFIEFWCFIANDEKQAVKVHAKIDRETAKITIIELEQSL